MPVTVAGVIPADPVAVQAKVVFNTFEFSDTLAWAFEQTVRVAGDVSRSGTG